jgi:hypothetical protein
MCLCTPQASCNLTNNSVSRWQSGVACMLLLRLLCPQKASPASCLRSTPATSVAMRADSVFVDFDSRSVAESVVSVGGGSIVLDSCHFKANRALVPSLVHAGTPAGARLFVRSVDFQDNEVGGEARVSRVDRSAGVFAEPQVEVLDLSTNQNVGSAIPTAIADEVFLQPTDPWLPQHLDSVSLQQPPFWGTPTGTATFTPPRTPDANAAVSGASPPPPPLPVPGRAGSSGKKGGATAGAVLGVLAVIVALAGCALLVVRRRRKRRDHEIDIVNHVRSVTSPRPCTAGPLGKLTVHIARVVCAGSVTVVLVCHVCMSPHHVRAWCV